MSTAPTFPDSKPLTLGDRPVFSEALSAMAPATSELNFTNLFIWRDYFQTSWCRLGDWLVVVFAGHGGGACALEPIGPPGRAGVVEQILPWLASAFDSPQPRMERVSQALVTEVSGLEGISATPLRDHFDYVYSRDALVHLKGKRLHAKRNHINRFRRNQAFEYRPIDAALIVACMELAEEWCGVRVCSEDMSLTGEHEAVIELLANYDALGLSGGTICVQDRVEAFSVADRLNPHTAVVHVEKANPQMPELYTLINQQAAEHALTDVTWINREQDLGEPGLRKAKQSYHPDHLVEKFRLVPTQEG